MPANHPYTITCRPRQLKLLFFVDREYEPADLRKLLLQNLRLWGGRYNPIVPVSQNSLTNAWKAVLNFQDPDYIYYSKGIDRQFIQDTCDEFGINPVEIMELDDRLNEIMGTHWANILPVLSRTPLLMVSRLWEIDSPLMDFYQLNFLVEQDTPYHTGLYKKHQPVAVNPENFGQINQIIAQSFVKNNTTLSEINVADWKLRLANPVFHSFELVIAKDENCFEELIYHWNKKLYDLTHRDIQSLLLTKTELMLLLTDDAFKQVLKNFSLEHLGIALVSFSLDQPELETLAALLQAFSGLNRFEVKEVSNFPFAIRDRQGLNQQTVYEKESVQVIMQGQPFVFLPSLSFKMEFNPFSQAYGFDLKISEILGPFNKSLKFPVKLIADYYTENPSRVKRNSEIFVAVAVTTHQEGKFHLKIPRFFDVISQIITSPKVTGSREINNIYRQVSYSDGSNKLSQFLKLFDGDFVFLSDFLSDKFWSDIFMELTNNTRSEGDTITFEQIYERCYPVMVAQGKVFKPKGQSRINEENLRLGLRDTLQKLSENKIFLPGFVLKCSYCSSRIWYSLAEIKDVIVCKGCSNLNYFQAENPISYKLNHLIKNNLGMVDDKGKFAPDGNITAIRTLIYIWNKAVNSFQYLPQIDIYDCTDSNHPMTDLDIVAMSSNELYIGECKHNSNLFAVKEKKCLLNLIKIAQTVKPDKIILSCTVNENTEMEKAADFIRRTIKDWKNKPEVIAHQVSTPTYFGSNDHRYFRH